MPETTVIETTAETVEEDWPADGKDWPKSVRCKKCGEAHFDNCDPEKLRPEDLEADEVPTYTVAMAIEWMKRPENDARIKSMVERAQQAEKTFVQAADREIGKVGRLLIDIGTSDDILEDFTASFLSSITGIGR